MADRLGSSKISSLPQRTLTEGGDLRVSCVRSLNSTQRPFIFSDDNSPGPLSDMHEISSSSHADAVRKKISFAAKSINPRDAADPAVSSQARLGARSSSEDASLSPQAVVGRRGLTGRPNSVVSLPLSEVPVRKSSASVLRYSLRDSQHSSMQDFGAWKAPSSSAVGQAVPNRLRTVSPVRGALTRDAVSSATVGGTISKTIVRTAPPLHILDDCNSRHDRVTMSLNLPAPLSVGGGTIEGQVSLIVDGGNERRTRADEIFISTLSIDVYGIEEINDGRRWIFLSLATQLFDLDHPPPASLVITQTPISQSELFWPLKQSTAVLPFCVHLPLNVGPPPYSSKQASIRYMICPTLVIKTGGKKSTIRQASNIQVLTVHDPEKALASLPSPLLASDLLSMSNGAEVQSVKLTAGLHRQTWVNGAMIFVDIHVANNSSKAIKKVEIQLEKVSLWYAHAAAGTAERIATHLRLPRRSNNEIVTHSILKKSKNWRGVPDHSSEVRTCDIFVPRNHVTISTGRYFEVRYFLNVLVHVRLFKSLAVQLPVTIIHMNSLDIVPNSLAQVAASVEAKRSRTVPFAEDRPLYPRFQQGQAFAAPRRQSLDRAKNGQDGFDDGDLDALTREVQNSPRRSSRNVSGSQKPKPKPHIAPLDGEHKTGRPSDIPMSHRYHHTRHPTCYHCNLNANDHGEAKTTSTPVPGPKLPRLQLATSDLGFSESEFEVPPDTPPRKVMLSESERRMIQQQRELRLQRQIGLDRRQKLNHSPDTPREQRHAHAWQGAYSGWRNVAADAQVEFAGPKFQNFSHAGTMVRLGRTRSVRVDGAADMKPAPQQRRSRTHPDPWTTVLPRQRWPRGSVERAARLHSQRSLDQGDRLHMDRYPSVKQLRVDRRARSSLERR